MIPSELHKRAPAKISVLNKDGDISKKEIRLIKQRFINLHKMKMARAREAISSRQTIFLDILPLLFHVNHPILPGYISAKTPAGIADYAPSKLSLDKAKMLGKGFEYKKRARRVLAIEAIFLMGSVGSIAYAKSSDMDLWLCYSPQLSEADKVLLQEKALEIEKWAETLGLEVHFFLMNAAEFKDGVATPLSAESSGSTQHYLLLEEFYRTALYVAGRYPVWWIVPPEAEQNYSEFVNNLLERRFIDSADVIDFGGLEKVPAEEFLSSSFWHLYKAIDSPYKSLLKLILMEAYVADYPQVKWAAVKMKTAVYNGETDINQMDAYLILYSTLEDYLISRQDAERLGLMRFCFYSKVSESSLVSSSKRVDWRQSVVADKVNSWGELPSYIADVISKKPRKIRHIQQENKRLTKELTQSYRRLIRFSKETLNVSMEGNVDLTLLGRKLKAVFEKSPGKLERASSKTSKALQEEKVIIKQIVKDAQAVAWLLVSVSETGQETGLKQARSLVELLTWAVEYNVIGKKTTVALNPGLSQLTAREVQHTIKDIQLFFKALPSKAVDLSDYKSKPRTTHVALVLNSGHDPMAKNTEQGIHLTSDRSDALSYGAQRRNLVESIEVVYRNSWNEVLFSKFNGIEGLMACFCRIFDPKALGRNQKLPLFMCASHSSTRANSIAKRVEGLFAGIAAGFKQHKKSCSPRYVIRSANAYFILQVEAGKMGYVYAKDRRALLSCLGNYQHIYSPVVFDQYAIENSFLAQIYQQHTAGGVQLFYYQKGGLAEVYLIDEKGSLYYREQVFENENSLLHPYQSVLISSRERRKLAAGDIASLNLEQEDQFYRIEKTPPGWSFTEVISDDLDFFLNLEIRVSYDQQSQSPHLYCDEEDFSSLEYGDKLYIEAARFVHSHRLSNERYPVYITDIDVPTEQLGVRHGQSLQTCHILQYKQRIEEKLNI